MTPRKKPPAEPLPVVVTLKVPEEPTLVVTIGDRSVPERTGALLNLEAHGIDVFLDLVVEDGRYVVNELRVRRHPGTGSLNNTRLGDDLPVRELVEIVTEAASAAISEKLGRDAAWNALGSSSPKPAKRWAVNDDHLRKVAEVYKSATSAPTEAVARAFPPVSHRTATRWVGECRKRGFLPPTTKGKATR